MYIGQLKKKENIHDNISHDILDKMCIYTYHIYTIHMQCWCTLVEFAALSFWLTVLDSKCDSHATMIISWLLTWSNLQNEKTHPRCVPTFWNWLCLSISGMDYLFPKKHLDAWRTEHLKPTELKPPGAPRSSPAWNPWKISIKMAWCAHEKWWRINKSWGMGWYGWCLNPFR